MIRLANVLLADADHDRADKFESRLTKLGYHAAVAEAVDDVMQAARVEHPDMILIGTPRDGDPITLGRALKADPMTADIPIVLVVDAVAPDVCAHAFSANLDEVLEAECDDSELIARLRPLGRLATMHAELRQRAGVAAGMGLSVQTRVEAPVAVRPAILVVGDDPAPVLAILGDEAEISVTVDLFEAEDKLGRSAFDAVIVSFAALPDGVLSFCSQVRNNPRLFNLPLVVLSDGTIGTTDIYRRGVTRVLVRPVDELLLRTTVLTLVHRQQLRWAIRTAMDGSLTEATGDPVTGAFGRTFLDAYLIDRLNIALSRDRHLSVVFFAAPSISAIRSQFGEDAALHLVQQLRQWISGLLRAEDLVALYGENEFCVALPDTPLAEAEVVMHRIAGVLAYTDFAVREVYQPVKLWVQVGATIARPGDDVATLVARARQNIG